jgi:membrane-bound lytic murein transglycosylase
MERNEQQCVFETKRSDIDFGRWDSYRLFYENPNRGYLSISHMCNTRLRRKFDNDNYLNFLAFVRINTDISSETAAARRIVNQQNNSNRQKMKNTNRTNNQSSKLISDYRQRFRFSLPSMVAATTTTTTNTSPTTTTFRSIRRSTLSSTTTPMKSLFVHVYSPTYSLNLPSTTRRWRSRRTRRP